jgi:hypothetical protein
VAKTPDHDPAAEFHFPGEFADCIAKGSRELVRARILVNAGPGSTVESRPLRSSQSVRNLASPKAVRADCP